VYVGLSDRGISVEARAVDLQVLHYTLHIVASLGDWDALDPVDRVDLRVAWIAVLCHPLLDPAAASISPGYRGDLHQSDRFGGRHVTLVEATFRAHNH
jgi:hypothetical protein